MITLKRCDSPQGGVKVVRKSCQVMEMCDARGRSVPELGNYDSCQEVQHAAIMKCKMY